MALRVDAPARRAERDGFLGQAEEADVVCEGDEAEPGDRHAQAREALEHPQGREDLRRLDGIGPGGADGGDASARFVFHAGEDAPGGLCLLWRRSLFCSLSKRSPQVLDVSPTTNLSSI